MEKNDLTEISGFNHLLEYYNAHKNTKWTEWLNFDQTFCKHGKQGLVGLLNPTKIGKEEKQYKFVFKINLGQKTMKVYISKKDCTKIV